MKLIIIKILYVFTVVIYIYIFSSMYFPKIIYIIFSTKGRNGPAALAKYILIAIDKLQKNHHFSKYYTLVHQDSINIFKFKLLAKRKNTFIWFEGSSFLNLIHNSTFNSLFKKVIYGPIVTPKHWFRIPLKSTYEIYWCDIIKKIKAYIVHSNRVALHIINKTNCYKYKYKYILLQPCIEHVEWNIYIKDYKERIIDFLVFIKYSDISKKDDERILLKYLESKYKVKIIKYGNFVKYDLFKYANMSKFIIYFSFYDTGALSLLEMKLMGIWPISHQKEFVENGYGSYVKELDNNIYSAIESLDKIYTIVYSPHKLSQNVISKLNCYKSLFNSIKKIFK